MSRPRTPASQSAAGLTAVAGSLHLVDAVTAAGTPAYVTVLHLVAGVLGLLVAAKLARDNCFESRLAAVALALAGAAGVLLTATVGLPTLPPSGLSAQSLLLLVVGVLVPGLVALDLRQRRAAEDQPYAS